MQKQNDQIDTLSRSLKSRHVMMIAIGGAIGTGLFLGSGTAIRNAGPSVILSYLIFGIFVFFMMRALGELLMSDLSKHSFIDFIKEYLGNKTSFVIGWMYFGCFLACAMADLTASGIYFKFWFPDLPQWIPPLVILVCLLLINMVNVSMFGELESWLSMVKILAIIALIVVGAILVVIHAHIGNSVASLSNLTSHHGFFPTGLSGFIESFQMVAFAFAGIEMVGLTAGETKDPINDIPKSINSLPVRIGLFYVGSMIAIMSVYPWNKIQTSSSPFVQVFSGAGIAGAATILNIVVITATVSATNSALFSTSRSLYSLAKTGHAPKRFTKLSSSAVPNKALQFSSLLLFFVVILNYIIPGKVFEIISSVAAINFIFVWIVILFCHYKYRQKMKQKGQNADELKFKMPGYPFTDWISLVFFIAILILLVFLPQTKLAMLISVIWVGILLIFSVAIERKKTQNN
nr:amino acid permease [uncultured Ligilactobacillus sp.]